MGLTEMTVLQVPNVGHWACVVIECACGHRTAHVFLIGTVDGLSCRCGAPAVPLGWEDQVEPMDEPCPN